MFTLDESRTNLVKKSFFFLLAAVFCALFGVVVNLHFPRFDWINETVAVKQSMSTFIAMFASMGAVLVPVVLYFLASRVMGAELYLLLVALVFAALGLVQYRWLMTAGARRFQNL